MLSTNIHAEPSKTHETTARGGDQTLSVLLRRKRRGFSLAKVYHIASGFPVKIISLFSIFRPDIQLMAVDFKLFPDFPLTNKIADPSHFPGDSVASLAMSASYYPQFP